MRKKLLFLGSIILSFGILHSCSSDDNDTTDGGSNGVDISDNFETNTQVVSVDNAVTIAFDGTEVTVNNPYADLVTVTSDNGNVLIEAITTSTELNYVVSGKTTDGSIKINSKYKYGLILNGVSIISSSGPAVNIQSSKKASITLVDKTNNRLVDGTTYPESSTEDMKGVLFSEGQLIFSGQGKLQIVGRTKHGICSDNYIIINSGNITISSAPKDGIHSNDYFEMNGGTLLVNSTGDGIECEAGYICINDGTLTITSQNGDAIKTSYKSDDLNRNIDIAGGTITLNIDGDASKGIKSKADINVLGGTIVITSTGDAYYDSDEADTSSSAGIKADGNVTIGGTSTQLTIYSTGSGGKGINVGGTLVFDGATVNVTTSGNQYVYSKNVDTASKAIKSTGNLIVNSGVIKIKTSKTEAEGLESKATLTINGGNIEIEAYDDCINASNHIEITGGTIYCVSETNDAIDSNGTMSISGGTVIAIGSSAPEAGFDCDNNTFKITGGTLIGFGGSTSTPTSNVCTQRSVVYGGSSYSIVHVESSAGDDFLTFKLPKTFSRTVMLFSSPDIIANTSYTIYTGGSVSGGSNSNGLYTGATYTKGTSAATFTASSMVTTVGTSGGGGPR